MRNWLEPEESFKLGRVMSIRQVIYVSTAVGSSALEDITGILDCSRQNNEAAGVTGLLVQGEGCFVQVLEGPRDAVETIKTRIEADNRHNGVHVLSDRTREEREFGDLAMGFAEASKVQADGVCPLNRLDFNAILPEFVIGEVRAILAAVRDTQLRQQVA